MRMTSPSTSSCPARRGARRGSRCSGPTSRGRAEGARSPPDTRCASSAARSCFSAVPIDPRATYRIQLRPGFGFAEAAAIASYLADLGVSHLYSSPGLQAAPGSTHGYDVIDPGRVSTDLGGDEAHAALLDALAGQGLGQMLDLVPNHMAILTPGNRWWWDVLENGPASRYADYFDVDWDPPEAKLRNTVLLPVLGDHYGRVLEAGGFTLAREGGSFTIRHEKSILPVAPPALQGLLAAAAHRSRFAELAFLADAHGRLPLSTELDRESRRRRHRDKEVLRADLARLFAAEPAAAEAVDAQVAAINADADALDAFLQLQNYRLAFWRTAARDLGYRRFFDVNHLVGLRVEDERVFEETHELVLRWLAEGRLDAVRIDHADGLRDPEEYLGRLAARAPAAWIVVEKILGPGERLPAGWPVAGTTGYDFLNLVGRLFVDPYGCEPLTRFYAELTGEPAGFAEIAYRKKELVLREALGSDLNRLAALFIE